MGADTPLVLTKNLVAYENTKADFELLQAQNDIAFVIVAPLAHLSANRQEWWFWLAAVLRSYNPMPFLSSKQG